MSMLSLDHPPLNWVALARGMGMEAWEATTAEAFNDALARSLSQPGPSLIEAVI